LTRPIEIEIHYQNLPAAGALLVATAALMHHLKAKPSVLTQVTLAFLLTLAVLSGASGNAYATVFYARNELMELAFPDADEVRAVDFFLRRDQRIAIEALAGSKLPSDLVTVYVGVTRDTVVGYAILDTHTIRTMPETLLVTVDPAGRVAATYVVAFYEPLEYLPSSRWLTQLPGRVLDDQLRLGRSISGITGSTLSSRAVVDAVRRALAICRVLVLEAP